MHDWTLLAPGGFPAGGLRASYRSDPAVRPREVSQPVQALWERRRRSARRAGRTFFNGRLFRVLAFHGRAGSLTLELSDTDYRSYVAAREGLVPPATANPLGVAAALITEDGYILVGQRQGVDAYAGRYDVIGGFVDRNVDWQEQDGERQPDPAGAILREALEETGASVAASSLVFLGLVDDLVLPHATLCFAARLPLAFADLAGLSIRDQETARWEPLADEPETLARFLQERHGGLSPTGEATLTLWGRHRFGAGWLPAR